jgi:hypothetical protein
MVKTSNETVKLSKKGAGIFENLARFSPIMQRARKAKQLSTRSFDRRYTDIIRSKLDISR